MGQVGGGGGGETAMECLRRWKKVSIGRGYGTSAVVVVDGRGGWAD